MFFLGIVHESGCTISKAYTLSEPHILSNCPYWAAEGGEEIENYHLLSVEQEVLHEFSHVEGIICHDYMRKRCYN